MIEIEIAAHARDRDRASHAYDLTAPHPFHAARNKLSPCEKEGREKERWGERERKSGEKEGKRKERWERMKRKEKKIRERKRNSHRGVELETWEEWVLIFFFFNFIASVWELIWNLRENFWFVF
jgi:hypothetical protein